MSWTDYGRFTTADAAYKPSTRPLQSNFTNNLTRRNTQLTELHPLPRRSSCLASANIKALRLFRYACRMLPFILKIHEIQHRVTPVQSKRYVANWFRRSSKETNLQTIDQLVEYGYKTVYEAEMHYSNTGYLYKFIIPPVHKKRDFGVDRFYDRQANKIKQEKDSKFLESFYRGEKSHNL